MKWIVLKDRNPDEYGRYFVKVKYEGDDELSGTYLEYSWVGWINSHFEDGEVIEWLDESPSLSLSAEQEAMEYAEDKVNKDGVSHAYTGQQVFEMLIAAYLAGKASGGDGWLEWLSIKEDKYLLVDNVIFIVHPWDDFADGDFEANELIGGDRILISKNDVGFYVVNAMNSGGVNCREKYSKSKFQLLLPTPPVK